MPQPNLTGDTEDNRNDLDHEGVVTDGASTNSDDVKVISYDEAEQVQSDKGTDTEDTTSSADDTEPTDDAESKPMSAAVAQAVAELGDFTGEAPQEITTETKVETVTETPASVPAPKSESAPVVSQDQPSQQPATAISEPAKPAKRGKGWLIGVIIAAIIFLGICGIAIWYFAFYNNPDKVAYDAINKLVTADNVAIDGGLVVSTEDIQLIIDLDSSSSKLPNSSNIDILVTASGSEPAKIKLDIGSIQMRDGDIYVRVDGIIDALETLGVDEDDNEILIGYLEEFEGEWWKISVPEIVDEFELGEFGEGVKEAYTCIVNNANTNDSAEMAELYSQNRFIKVEPVKEVREGTAISEPESGYRFYQVSLDKEKLANYMNSIPNTKTSQETVACLNSVAEEYYGTSLDITSEKVSANDIDIPDDLQIYLEISQFGHELRSVRGVYGDNTSDEIIPLSFALVFKYETAPSVSAPSSYRSITELIEEILMDMYYGDLDIDIDEYYPDEIDFDLDSITMEV